MYGELAYFDFGAKQCAIIDTQQHRSRDEKRERNGEEEKNSTYCVFNNVKCCVENEHSLRKSWEAARCLRVKKISRRRRRKKSRTVEVNETIL